MRFFFYGTLAEPGINRVSRLIHQYLAPIGPARVNGALFAIGQPQGWYPALVPGDGEVAGQLFSTKIGFGASQLARVDAYEDFIPGNPERSLYLRELLPVTDEAGSCDPAMVYRYNKPLPRTALPIVGGDFIGWLAQTGNRAFS